MRVCVCVMVMVSRWIVNWITMIAIMGFGNSMLCVCKTGTSCV